MLKLNEYLRKIRTENGFTQKQLSDYLGVDVTTYAHYELGSRSPNYEKLQKIAEFYGMDDELLGTGKSTMEYVNLLEKNLNISRDKIMEAMDINEPTVRRLTAYVNLFVNKIINSNGIRRLIARSKIKMKNSEYCYQMIDQEEGFIEECCFNLQQAIEISIEAIVRLQGLIAAENHEIRDNMLILSCSGITIPRLEEIRRMESMLDQWKSNELCIDISTTLKENIEEARVIAKDIISYAESLIETIDDVVMNDIPDKKI